MPYWLRFEQVGRERCQLERCAVLQSCCCNEAWAWNGTYVWQHLMVLAMV
jgi:hypothetical protein